MKNLSLLLGFVCLIWTASSSQAGEVTLKVIEKEPPKEVGEAIRKVLQPKAVQLLEDGKTLYEFWLRQEVPLRSKPESPEKSLQALDEITLMGAAFVGEGRRDYKDSEIHPGPYTIRFGLQPQDGDHLGTSEYPYFAVLIPAAADSSLDTIKTYKAMVRASRKATTADHPAVLSLRPVSGTPKDAPAITEPTAEHKAVRLQVPGKASGSDQPSMLMFELVFEGRYKG